ncbi:hypothetical protein PVK06_008765 [Gossypium arboreum]|uniref:Uncharacterized protein n=1 Tax=Gossypium arboreum TaxID=29729 RepID=A0ABR0QKR8_GOSAR|nr:hypothetical protein PVK06_008765 [Gossypium arboreum]
MDAQVRTVVQGLYWTAEFRDPKFLTLETNQFQDSHTKEAEDPKEEDKEKNDADEDTEESEPKSN